MTRDELRQLVVSEGLGRVADQIVAEAKPCLRMQSSFFNGEELVGVSKIGGNPSLPKDIEWPYWNDKPLAFLAQISLRDIESFGFDILPKNGYLWFFYDMVQTTWGFDPNDIGSFRVIYSEMEKSSLELRPFPEPDLISDDGYFYGPLQLRFRPEISIPPWESLFVDSLNLSKSEKDLYIDKVENNETLIPQGPKHQILGHPIQIQGEMQTECQLVSHGLYCGGGTETGYNDPRRSVLEKGALNWQLLLQIDSDDGACMMWGDCGMLYFWIREQDLKNRAFDQAWMILQCG